MDHRGIRPYDWRGSKLHQQSKLDPIRSHLIDDDGEFEDTLVNRAGSQPASSTKLKRHRAYPSNAFYRWLQTQIGRPWSKVHSEAIVRLNGLKHMLEWAVEEYVNINEKGEVFEQAGRTYFSGALRPGKFYVHPKTHLLQMVPTSTRRYKWRMKKHFVVSDGYAYWKRKSDGLIFRFKVEDLKPSSDVWRKPLYYSPYNDVTMNNNSINIPRFKLPDGLGDRSDKSVNCYHISGSDMRSAHRRDIQRIQDELKDIDPL